MEIITLGRATTTTMEVAKQTDGICIEHTGGTAPIMNGKRLT
jgi:hypothetical protein